MSERKVRRRGYVVGREVAYARTLINTDIEALLADLDDVEETRGACGASGSLLPLPSDSPQGRPSTWSTPPQPRPAASEAKAVTPKQVVSQILERTGLEAPEPDRSLWRYRVTVDDLALLQQGFTWFDEVPERLDRESQGALVLYAANVLCERAEAGGWRWQPLYEALGWLETPAGGVRLRDHVESGLRYWGRPLRSSGGEGRYLGTMLLEGGLPSGWLRGSGGVGVQRFLRRLVKCRSLYGEELSLFVDEYRDLLPGTLGRDQSAVGLLVQLVHAVFGLQRQLPEGCEDPVSYLNQAVSGWRTWLPLPATRLEEADEIFLNLLRVPEVEAAEEVAPLSCEWSVPADGEAFHWQLLLPDRIGAAALTRPFGLAAEALPPLCYLGLENGAGRRIQLARLERCNAAGDYEVTRVGPERVLAVGECRTLLFLDGQIAGECSTPGGQALPADAPWILDDLGRQQARLLALGACQLRHRSVIVAVPDGASEPVPVGASKPVPDGAGESVLQVEGSEVQRLQQRLGGRTCYRLRGSAVIQVADESFGVACNSDATLTFRLELEGRPCVVRGARGPAFLGLPAVYARSSECYMRVPEAELQWRPARGTGAYGLVQQQRPLGDISLRFRRDGATLATLRACVLPEDFDVAFEGSGRERSLCVRSKRLVGVSLEDGSALSSRQVSTGDFRLSAAASHFDQAEERVCLHWVSGGTSEVWLPIPAMATGFTDLQGRWLSRTARVDIGTIDCVRARGVGTGDFELSARMSGGTWQLITFARPLKGRRRGDEVGVVELSLDAVRAQLEPLLSSGRLDGTIELMFAPRTHAGSQIPRLRIGHYAQQINVERQGTAAEPVGFNLKVVPATDSPVGVAPADAEYEFQLLSLKAPWDPPQPIERFDQHHFWVGARGLAPGPYLALAYERGRLRGRPVLVNRPGDEAPPTTDFERAACEPRFEQRAERFAGWLDRLSRDFMDPSWHDLQRVLDLADRIPPQAFEVLCRLAEHPKACATAILRQPSPDHQRRVLRILGKLGVDAHLLPLQTWFAAWAGVADVAERYAQQGGLPDRGAFLSAIAGGAFGSGNMVSPLLAVLRSFAHRRLQTPPGQGDWSAVPELQAVALLSNWWREVLARSAERQWPQYRFDEAGVQAAEGLDFEPCRSFQQNVQRAPAVAAAMVFFGHTVTADERAGLARMAAFDRQWFDYAQAMHLVRLTQRYPERLAGCFQ